VKQQHKFAEAGNTGPGVRSDCFISLELKKSGGIQIDLKSKVKSMYGKSILALCREVIKHFGIKHAGISIEDSGALPFVISARIEAVIKKIIETDKEYLPDMLEESDYPTNRGRFRFSRLYLPGNTPGMMINAGIHRPDGVILDLEDSVAREKKAEARILVRNALRQVNFYGAERMVRINQLQEGLVDLKYIVPHNIHIILVPKCEDAEQIKILEEKIQEIKNQHNINKDIYLMPIIESALGVEESFKIALSSPNIVAMAIGLEDYTADLGTRRTKEAMESFYARIRLVNACKAAGIQPIDSVFSDVEDMEGLQETVRKSKSLGFEGMGCIHPRQIIVIRESFAPDKEEIKNARQIIKAFIEAKEKGLGVVSLGTKMIDPPVVRRAEKIINLAISLGLLERDWRGED
jgi:citrate lyase subunit beta/citryl-CoA lyase